VGGGERLLAARDEEDAGRRPVEPVDEVEVGAEGEADRGEEPAGPVDGVAGGLVERDVVAGAVRRGEDAEGERTPQSPRALRYAGIAAARIFTACLRSSPLRT
jgi:hypothetical protein